MPASMVLTVSCERDKEREKTKETNGCGKQPKRPVCGVGRRCCFRVRPTLRRQKESRVTFNSEAKVRGKTERRRQWQDQSV